MIIMIFAANNCFGLSFLEEDKESEDIPKGPELSAPGES
jgi:hypothetical protein